MPMISVVIPTYNKHQNLKKVYEKINEIMTLNKYCYELIFVDDGSKDETGKVIKDLCRRYNNIKGIILNKNYGQQNATLAGIRLTGYNYVITVDDDLQYDLWIIPQMISELEKGYDVVYGVTGTDNRERYRRWGTFIKELVFKWLLRKPKGVRLTSFRAMKRNIADYVTCDPVKNVYISARILQITQKVQNISMVTKIKKNGSRYKWHGLIGVLWGVLCNYTCLPLIKRLKKCGVQYSIKELIT